MSIQRSTFFPLSFLLFTTTACVQWPDLGPINNDETAETTSETAASTSGSPMWPDLIPTPSATTGTSMGPGGTLPNASKGNPLTTDGDPPDSETSGASDVDPNLGLLLLTEVHSDPEGKDGGNASPEWIEIYNPSMDAIALAGLVIESRSWPIKTAEALGLSEHSLLPGQFLRVCRYASKADLPTETFQITEFGLEVAFSTNSGLRNDDGGILLTTKDQGLVDMLIYGANQESPFNDPTMWNGDPAPAPSSGFSLCRVPVDGDSNTLADWMICEPSPGAPSLPSEEGTDTSETGDEPETTSGIATTSESMDSEQASDTEPAEQANIAIVEVYSHPQGDNIVEKQYEFVEIVNLSQVNEDLSGWTIADSLELNAPGTDPILYHSGSGGCDPVTCLAPGQRAIIVGNEYKLNNEADTALVLQVDDASLAFGGLADHEPVVLRDANQQLRSTYRDWSDPQAEPLPGPGEKAKAVVRAVAQDPDLPENWLFAEQATPGF